MDSCPLTWIFGRIFDSSTEAVCLLVLSSKKEA
uniref:Uncharacterized protein n=1 Tax=Parascaris equorum TaxID=6256 RepID=A0A914RGV0_PAREQ